MKHTVKREIKLTRNELLGLIKESFDLNETIPEECDLAIDNYNKDKAVTITWEVETNARGIVPSTVGR